jgi:ribosomal protein S30
MPATFLQQKFHHGSIAESGSVTNFFFQDPEMENPPKNRKQNKNKTENRREQLPRISYEAQQI